MTTDETAEYLSVSPWTLLRWRQIEVGPRYARLLGRTIRYKRSDVDAWMQEHSIHTDDQPESKPRERVRLKE